MSVQEPTGIYAPSNFIDNRGDSLGAVGGGLAFWTGKRVFDIAMSLALLPVFVLVAVALAIINPWLNPGPLFFRQQRMGRHTQAFTALKFRSMSPVAAITRGVHDPIETDRIRPLGNVLRRMRIDELPQIINVLRGEMSLIGPRPDYFEHARTYLAQIPEYRARHAVRPGISGFAQVTLGYAEGIDATRAKANADLAYIRNASLGLEILVFWLTLVTIILRRGA